jgi:hypothetical protein
LPWTDAVADLRGHAKKDFKAGNFRDAWELDRQFPGTKKPRPSDVPWAAVNDWDRRLLMRVLVSRLRVFIGLLTVFLRTGRVFLRFIMLAVIMVMRGFVMVVSGSLMFGSRVVMMITRSVLLLVRHYQLLTRHLCLDGDAMAPSKPTCKPRSHISSAFGAKGPAIRPPLPEVQRSYLNRISRSVAALTS